MNTRPQPVVAAVVLIAVNAIGGVIASAAWLDIEDRGSLVIGSLVLAALLLIPAWFLWQGKKWGAYAAIATNALNILATVPFFFEPEPASLAIPAGISVALGVAAIVLIWQPSARAFWDRRRAIATV